MQSRDELLKQCWANASPWTKCVKAVPEDPDHVGLCDDHLAKLREESNPNDA